MDPIEVIIPIAAFAMILGCVYISVTAWHRQRMAMIEKGLVPGSLPSKDPGSRTLRNGMFLVAIGIGLLCGRMLEPLFQKGPDDDNPLSYFISVLIFGGAALVLHHIVVSRKDQA